VHHRASKAKNLHCGDNTPQDRRYINPVPTTFFFFTMYLQSTARLKDLALNHTKKIIITMLLIPFMLLLQLGISLVAAAPQLSA
jgi:hypothetical protein